MARELEWPEVAVALPGRAQPITIAGRRAVWEGFIRWADGPARLAAFQALEAVERSLQTLGAVEVEPL